MDKSTSKCETLRVEEILSHENAENLEVIPVWGYTCVVGRGQFQVGDLICYIPPESIVDTTRPEFSFLHRKRDKEKITVKKLRGVISQGLILKVPDFAQEGQDLSEYFGVEHYSVPEDCIVKEGILTVKPPPGQWQKYDVDSARKYNRLFSPGEPVFISQKINGANYRCCFREGKQYVGARTTWKSEDYEEKAWWNALTPNMRKFCEENPSLSLYGELCGQVKGFRYFNTPTFLAFDIARFDWTFLDVQEFLDLTQKYEIPTVPVLKVNHPFDYQECCELAEGQSSLNSSVVNEGVVIKPMRERWDKRLGRVCLKIVGNDYLAKS